MGAHADDMPSATHSLALLQAQAEVLRAEIDRMRLELASITGDVQPTPVAELVEANGQLVLAALRAEATAETAASELDELTHSSQRDALTDLPNRALMLDRLQSAMTSAQRRGSRLAVLFVDVDHFKQINDSLGHAAGDEVLRIVTERLLGVVRVSDTVSRHGGDEFLVLLPDISRTADAGLAAGEMLAAISEPCRSGDRTLQVTASVGIAMYPGDADSPQALIAHADAAMYSAKTAGRGRFSFGPQIDGAQATTG